MPSAAGCRVVQVSGSWIVRCSAWTRRRASRTDAGTVSTQSAGECGQRRNHVMRRVRGRVCRSGRCRPQEPNHRIRLVEDAFQPVFGQRHGQPHLVDQCGSASVGRGVRVGADVGSSTPAPSDARPARRDSHPLLLPPEVDQRAAAQLGDSHQIQGLFDRFRMLFRHPQLFHAIGDLVLHRVVTNPASGFCHVSDHLAMSPGRWVRMSRPPPPSGGASASEWAVHGTQQR